MEPMAALGGAGPPVLLVVDEECIGEADLSPERIVALAAKAPIAVLAPISRPPVAAAIETATVLERPASSAALLAVARAAVQRSAEPRADPGAVLIVEDNPLNQEVAAVMLRSLGYRTTVVDDGPSAVGLVARGERFDAILMDGQMPGMSGFEASRSIRELEAAKGLPRTPIIACTAGERDRVSAIARDAGMDHILSKPLVKPALVSVLSQLDGSPPVRTSAVAAEEPVGPIDTRVLAGLSLLEQEDGSPLLPSLLASYREKMATGLARLEDLTRAHAGEEAAAVAHHLKGSSLQLGARLVAGSLREVEHACAASDFALALARLESVRGAQVAALAELEARVRT
jgi:CheY-like chemotaxis protein